MSNCTNGKPKTLRARMNKRGSILKPPDARNSYGESTGEFVAVIPQIWAAIEPLRGQEFFAAMRENAEVTTRIRIRYREGIERKMIFRHKSVDFEILYMINPEYANEELQLMCKERQ